MLTVSGMQTQQSVTLCTASVRLNAHRTYDVMRYSTAHSTRLTVRWVYAYTCSGNTDRVRAQAQRSRVTCPRVNFRRATRMQPMQVNQG